MARLPVPGQDSGTWGDLLNEFLRVEYNEDGTLKSSGSLAGKVDKATVTTKGDLLAATGASAITRLGVGSDGQALVADSASSTGLSWGNVATNSHTTVTKNSNYTATASDEVILVNAGSGSVTITLPSATANKRMYDVKKIDASSNPVIIAAASGQTVDGGSSATVKVQYASVSVISDGSNWFVV